MFMRQLLSILLVAVLTAPGWASLGSVAGTVGTSQAATIRGAGVIPGTTIFSGDQVVVGAKGDASISFGRGSMARLSEETSLRVLKVDNRIALQLERGRVSFRSSEQLPVESRLADASIRSANGLMAVGVVSIRSANSAMIFAEKGTLLVATAHDSRSATVREGESVEVKLGPAPQPYVTPSGAPAGSGISAKNWVIVATIIGAATLATGLIISANENRLTCPQKINLVSPFNFPCP